MQNPDRWTRWVPFLLEKQSFFPTPHDYPTHWTTLTIDILCNCEHVIQVCCDSNRACQLQVGIVKDLSVRYYWEQTEEYLSEQLVNNIVYFISCGQQPGVILRYVMRHDSVNWRPSKRVDWPPYKFLSEYILAAIFASFDERNMSSIVPSLGRVSATKSAPITGPNKQG
jgi:hypothetical protein